MFCETMTCKAVTVLCGLLRVIDMWPRRPPSSPSVQPAVVADDKDSETTTNAKKKKSMEIFSHHSSANPACTSCHSIISCVPRRAPTLTRLIKRPWWRLWMETNILLPWRLCRSAIKNGKRSSARIRVAIPGGDRQPAAAWIRVEPRRAFGDRPVPSPAASGCLRVR